MTEAPSLTSAVYWRAWCRDCDRAIIAKAPVPTEGPDDRRLRCGVCGRTEATDQTLAQYRRGDGV